MDIKQSFSNFIQLPPAGKIAVMRQHWQATLAFTLLLLAFGSFMLRHLTPDGPISEPLTRADVSIQQDAHDIGKPMLKPGAHMPWIGMSAGQVMADNMGMCQPGSGSCQVFGGPLSGAVIEFSNDIAVRITARLGSSAKDAVLRSLGEPARVNKQTGGSFVWERNGVTITLTATGDEYYPWSFTATLD